MAASLECEGRLNPGRRWGRRSQSGEWPFATAWILYQAALCSRRLAVTNQDNYTGRQLRPKRHG